MNVLGISCYYHDAAATLVSNGKIIAAVEEERFTRRKHDNRFPELSIKYCLEEAGISSSDLDYICFYEKPLLKLERMLETASHSPDKSEIMVTEQLSHMLHERLFTKRVLSEKIGFEGELLFVEHHMAHAASSYYISGYDKSAVMTIDGVGEWATTVQYIGEGSSLKKIKEIRYPHSLGLLYSTVTAFLGFKVNNDEYKVMGLASYGEPKHIDKINRLVKVYDDGSIELNLDYFSFMYDPNRMYSDEFVELFGPPRKTDDEISDYHMDIASSLQNLLEETLIKMGNSFYEESGGIENICLAGGVALNSVANWRFIEETPFKNICIQPAAGDGGGSMGAALYAYYMKSDNSINSEPHTTLLGPSFSNEEIKKLLDERDAIYTKLSDDELCSTAAEYLHKNLIIGWFQGRMEFGPRALGNRSILANATNPEMKDILNARVKFREDFRPFAPAVLEERSNEYFDIDFKSPYMLFVPQVKEGMGEKIPSVTHTDNSARIQTVNKDENPRYYKLIEEFEKRSGVPVIINTSFNIRGEPIVCTPEDAYNCFLKTDIDFLFMGNYLVEKVV
ncbi:MAG: carbamoyltransferase [Candidatus Marinimicrobia bacterium]|nr:carbamoyltransferase [Candidatus Neomarinimicrobiota bacterium]